MTSTTSTDGQNNDTQTAFGLAALIVKRKQELGFTYRELEARTDGTVSSQRWQQLGTGVRIKEFPEPATLQAMASAMQVDETTVVLATAESVGLDTKPTDRTPSPPVPDYLDVEVAAITHCVAAIDPFPRPQRTRILNYLNDRYRSSTTPEVVDASHVRE